MEDKKIIELLFERSESAVYEISQKYGHYCKKISMNILGNESDAEECVNDAYLKAWDTIPPQIPNPLSAYLGMLTRTLSINRREKNTAQKRFGGFELLLDELSECVPSGDDVEGQYDGAQILKSLNGFLEQLDQRARTVFVSRYWECESIKEIARDFGIKENTVKTILYRTRNQLKNHLESEGFSI